MSRSHVVKEGECLASTAFQHGHLPDTIWNDDANAELRKGRNPYALKAGDVLEVPDLRLKQADVATGKVHRFRRRAVPEKFRARLCEDGKPRAKTRFELAIGDVVVTGETDDDGRLEQWMPPDAASAKLTLTLRSGKSEVYKLTFGTLAPDTTGDGLRRRLANLGRLRSAAPDAMTETALLRFQADHGLPLTGEPDDATREVLAALYTE
jgi:hypothetical protein